MRLDKLLILGKLSRASSPPQRLTSPPCARLSRGVGALLWGRLARCWVMCHASIRRLGEERVGREVTTAWVSGDRLQSPEEGCLAWG